MHSYAAHRLISVPPLRETELHQVVSRPAEREAAALVLLRTYVKFFTLVDVQQECGRLGLALLLQTILGGIEQTSQRAASLDEIFNPLGLARDRLRNVRRTR